MRRTNPLLLLLVCLLLTPAATAYAFTVPVATSFSTAVPAARQSVIQLQGSDAEGTSLVYATTTAPSHGALSSLNTATGSVVYTPTAGYTGSDSFNYTVTSGGETSAAGTVTIAVTNAKTTVTDTITDPSGAPRSGKVTFILTQQVQTPAGLSPVGASVSAALTSSGTFIAQLYPSRSMNPAAYYQVYFNDSVTLRQELLGVYDIPASTAAVSLSTTKVTDTNLAARYTFASAAGVAALTQAIAQQLVAAQIFPGITSGNVPFWNGTAFVNSALTQSGTTISAAGDVSVAGGVSVVGNLTVTGTINGSGLGEFDAAPNAPGYKVNDVQVVGAQGYNIADPDGTLDSNTEALKAVLAHLRGWGALSNLYRSTLNDGLISLWLLNNVNDAAGSNHLTNNASVTLNSAGANFSGSNYLSIANNSTLDVSAYQSFTLAARVRLTSKAASQVILSKTDGLSANEFSMSYASAADGFDRFRFTVYPGGTGQVGVSANTFGSPTAGVDYTVVGWYDAWSHQVCVAVNGGAADCAAATLVSHPYTAPFVIGRLTGLGAYFSGSARYVGFWSRVLSSEEKTELHDNGGALSYPLKDDTTSRTEFVVQPYQAYDSRAAAHAPAQPDGYFFALPYSRFIYTTTASSMQIEEFSNEGEAPESARQINVRVNGADYALVVAPQAGGVTTHTVALPAGQKTVEVWTGFQALFSGAIKGTWIRKITFNAAAQAKTAAKKTPHLVVYGDSIAASAGAGETPRGGWATLLRDAWLGSVAVEAWGGRSLAQDAANSSLRAQLVARISTQNPDAFLSWIGTNDYGGVGFGEQSAANFGTNLGAFLDDLHTASPATTIYAASMLPRTSTAANAYGNTLADYRSQVQTVCAARAWCTFIDGGAVPGFSTGSDLHDTVHPNDSGHAKIFNYVKTILGL